MVDGSLTFDTKIDTEGVENGTRTVKGALDSFMKTINNAGDRMSDVFDGSSSKVLELSNKINQTESEIQDLVAKMQELSNKQIDTAEFSELQNEIQKTENKLLSYLNRQEKLETLGVDKDSKAWKSLQYDIDMTDKKLNLLEADMTSLKASGLDKTLGSQSTEYQKMGSKLTQLNEKLNTYKARIEEASNGSRKMAKEVNKAGTESKKTAKEVDKASKSTSKFSKMMGMLGQSLMFSLVFRAFSAVTNAIKEGFQNLATYSSDANKNMSILSTSALTLKNSLVTAFNPILTAITPALQTLINYLSQAITTAGQFFAVFFNGATTFTKAKDAQVDYAKSLKNSAKEASKSLSSIDKLNNTTDTGSAGGATTGTPNPAQMFEEVEIDNKIVKFVEDLKTKLEPTIQAFERLKVAVAPFAENVGMGLKWLYENVLLPLGTWTITDLIPSFLNALGGAISVLNSLLVIFQPYALWLWENFLKPIATWTGGLIVSGLNLLTDSLYALSDWIIDNQETIIKSTAFIGSFFLAFKITGLVTALMPFISTLGTLISSGTLWSGILSLLGGLLSALTAPATIIATILGLLIYTFIDLYSSSELFREQIALLGSTWMEALEPLATFIETVLTDAWNEILLPVIDFFVKTLIPQLISIFKQLWQKVLVPFVTFIGEVFTPVVQILTDIWMSLWKNVILPIAKAIGGVLKEAWNAIYEILTKTIIPIVGKVIEILTFLWKNVVNPIIDVLWKSFKPAFDTVFKGIGDLITGLLGALKGLIKFVAGVFTGNWKKAWEGIQEIFKGIFDSLVAIAKTPINLIIDIINGLINGIASGINAVIDSVNAIKFDIPDWVPVFGGNSIGFRLQKVNAPKIPKLAQGAVIPPNSEFMAILGDQKKGLNIETPLQTMLDAFRQANAENGNTGGVIDLTLNLDGKAILKQLIKLDKEHYNATGKPLFT